MLRESKGLTQVQVANLLNKKAVSISNHERGHVNIPLGCLEEYSRIYAISMIQLISALYDQTEPLPPLKITDRVFKRRFKIKRLMNKLETLHSRQALVLLEIKQNLKRRK